eukprot:TRINITY_DN776076_c0_g1_i1.p1 TRINITY_DN776076_c0_g1~~TRINITY_DN776076_c0_g1_i1.p1  ORF type:complete len:225 (-),score=48.79 TRINITY_DN776076_c0_g1_i1:186-860(-)
MDEKTLIDNAIRILSKPEFDLGVEAERFFKNDLPPTMQHYIRKFRMPDDDFETKGLGSLATILLPENTYDNPIKPLRKQELIDFFELKSSGKGGASLLSAIPAGMLMDHFGDLIKELKKRVPDSKMWKKNPFSDPITKKDKYYADYISKIERPICLKDILRRMKDGTYTSFNDFNFEVRTMFENAREYNKPSHPVAKFGDELEEIYMNKVPKCKQGLLQALRAM